MKKVIFISICFALINLSFANPPRKFIIAGYLSKFQKFDLNTLPYYDRIYYFSTSPDSVGNFFLKDDLEKNISILKEKLSNKQELFLVVGGWTESKNIPLLCTDENKRIKYIETLIDFCLKNKINGVDLDWEDYPSRVSEEAYHKVIKDFSERIHAKGLRFTIALGPQKASLAASLAKYTDGINMMSYGKFDEEGNQAPTYLLKKWINDYVEAGVPKEKIIPGLPFYGKLPPSYPKDTLPVALVYSEIIKRITPTFEINKYDNYGFNGVNLIREKTKYSQTQGCGGIMIWEITGDTPYDSKYSLLKTIYEVREKE